MIKANVRVLIVQVFVHFLLGLLIIHRQEFASNLVVPWPIGLVARVNDIEVSIVDLLCLVDKVVKLLRLVEGYVFVVAELHKRINL